MAGSGANSSDPAPGEAGQGDLFGGRLVDPDPDARGGIATAAGEAPKSAREVLIIVNNEAEGSVPLGIVALARHMASEAGAS